MTFRQTIHELHSLLTSKQLSSVELTEAVYARINQVEDKIKAFVTLTKDEALRQARAADERIKNNDNVTPLTGIPLAIKDNFCTGGY